MVTVNFTWAHLSPRKPTIYAVLKARLGREPTPGELVADVRRILEEAREERLSRKAARRPEDELDAVAGEGEV